MEAVSNLAYKKHVFVCVNDLEEDKACCKKVEGYETFKELKRFVIENGLVKDVWVTKTGCLGFCNDVGCTIAIYPEKVWFMQTKKEDLEKLKEFIVKDLR